MWHLVSGGRKDEKFVHVPKVTSGDIYTFRFRGYRLEKNCKNLAYLAEKAFLGLCVSGHKAF